MKKLVLLLLFLITNQLFAQLDSGDMAFIAFNADNDDDFAMVTFVDIPVNTTLYFTDSEWTGTAFGTDENDFSWNSGNSIITAGTVITFNTISATVPSVSVGTITGEPGGISASAEAIFVFLVNDANEPRVPSTFIAAVANSSSGYGSLDGTNLIEGTTAITYPSGTDVAQYVGPRTGLQANGYLVALNDMTNYTLDDASGDQSALVLPFDTTSFVMSSIDTTAPSVSTVNITSATTLDIVFSEDLTPVSAENLTNYAITNGVTITTVSYNTSTHTATVTHSGFLTGIAYQLTVNDIEDLSSNMQNAPFQSDDLFFNTLTSGLVITEIMYNTASDNDALEFLEIYNASSSAINLGGIQVKDESNFIFTFPQQTLAPQEIVLLATDKTTADAFYGVTFLDMPQGISNALGNGGEVLQILNSEQTLIFEMEYSDDEPWPTSADGDGPSLELQNPNGNFNEGTNWVPATNLVGIDNGFDVFASPGVFEPNTNVAPEITFAETVYNVSENDSSISIVIETSTASTNDITVDVALVTELQTATLTTDFTFTNQTVTIPANSTAPITLTIEIIDDITFEADELFLLELTNPINATLGSNTVIGIYILDNDVVVPAASNLLDINFATSYLVDDAGSAEISAYDAATQRLFVLNSTGAKIEILDFSDLTAINTITSIDLSAYGTEGPTSVATHNGFVVASVSNGPTADGIVLFMDTNGTITSTVTVGNLPDMVTFSPDGTKVLVANEGQPNNDYTIDPEGSITVIDVTGGLENITQANVIHINFNNFDADLASLKAENVRIFGPGSSVSQDLEPEYITFSEDSQTAWVSLQENNAIGVIDLTTNTITDIMPLGLKDHSLSRNTIDTSNDTNFIFMANWPIKGMYMPDAIASYNIGDITYLVTANEGDAREYDAFEEEVSLGDITLDPAVFNNQNQLALDTNLGALSITNATGDIDNDGDFDEIHVFGTRSFSIWNTTTGALVYDSGDDFERITAADPIYGALFNASNSNNTFKNRSDNKGPEPEGVTVAQIDGEFYAFITLERVGGFMTYNVTNPENPVFESYVNNRDLGNDEGGDLGPEGILYISPEDSPSNTALIVLSNEVSSTVSVYSLDKVKLSSNEISSTDNNLKLFPNPSAANQTVFFNKLVDVTLFDIQGRVITSQLQTGSLKIPNVISGTYILKTNTGETKKIIIK
ncbi:choice-of-anchor I family protein [Psychroserpens damuponensis]|uniref:choice-of-anchor I family protein n=1 Tax=Psychroserpens damuponensis TaxID=943936 RepID=UPI0006946CA0|nr:choice-of-anchor I family protein [Psychroserpens damuponensis]